jgi:hypothetical protein
MVIAVYSSGLALSGIGKTPLVSNHPDREGHAISTVAPFVSLS